MMDRHKVIELLDISCAKALDAWWEKDVRCKAQSRAAMTALQDKLGSLQKPDYDCEYVPPAYVIRYQISHILMAWRALSRIDDRLKERWGVGAGRGELLRIVDFGTGVSAGRIGAALMAAEAFEDGRSIDHILFDEIDISSPMLEMGELIWQAFTQEVQRKLADSTLAYAVKIIHSRQYREWSKVKESDCETWLTALHVTYQDQDRGDLKKILKTLYRRVGPVAGAFSCYSSKNRDGGDSNLSQMKEDFPFDMRKLLHETADRSECSTSYMTKRAVHYGFRDISEKHWRPFLGLDCAILFGGSSRKLGAE